MNHNRDAGPLVPPFTRETGVLVKTREWSARAFGTELRSVIEYRLHLRPDGAAYELRSWRCTERGEWVCAAVPWMSALDWIACGRALEATPSEPARHE